MTESGLPDWWGEYVAGIHAAPAVVADSHSGAMAAHTHTFTPEPTAEPRPSLCPRCGQKAETLHFGSEPIYDDSVSATALLCVWEYECVAGHRWTPELPADA